MRWKEGERAARGGVAASSEARAGWSRIGPDGAGLDWTGRTGTAGWFAVGW